MPERLKTRHFATALAALLLGSALTSTPALASGTTAQPALGCYNLDCPTPGATLVDNGGPIITQPVVYLVRFSASKIALVPADGFLRPTFAKSAPNAVGAVRALLSSPADSWWMAEYSRPAQHEIIHNGRVGGVVTIYSPTLATAKKVFDSQIETALQTAARRHQIPVSNNAIFITFFRSGQDIVAAGLGNSIKTFCAYHSDITLNVSGTRNLYYAVIPNEGNALGCDYGGVNNGGLGAFDSMTSYFSHEIAETVTDPSETLAWANPKNDAEVADICSPPTGYPSYTDVVGPQTYYFQMLYSQSAQGCFGLPVATSPTVTQTGTSLSVNLTIDAYGAASGQTLDLYNGSSLLATAATDSTGTTYFQIPTVADGTVLTVSYAGAGPLDPSATQFVTNSVTGITQSLSASVLGTTNTPAHTTVVITAAPAQFGQVITLSGLGASTSTTTDGIGTAQAAVTITSGTHVLTVSTVAGTQSLGVALNTTSLS
jgi:hypothetical protein